MTLTDVRGTDYYLLDDLLTDEARQVRERVRAFVDRDLLPVINGYWDAGEFPFVLVPKIAGYSTEPSAGSATRASPTS